MTGLPKVLRHKRALAQILVFAFLALFTGLVLGYAFGASRAVVESA
jgi:hypothetical protein